MRLIAASLALCMLSACSARAGSDTSTTSSQVTTPAAPVTVTTAPATTTAAPDGATTTTAPPDVVVSDGAVSGPETVTVALGDDFEIVVLADVDDEVHVHGYDLHFEVMAGVPVVVSFPADVPGVFEVELESSGLGLFDLEVVG